MSRRLVVRSACLIGMVVALTATLAASPSAAEKAAGVDFAASGPVAPRIATPPGWSISQGPDSTQITWQSTAPIPMGNAPLQFWLGRELLGTPRPDADERTFTLEVTDPLSSRGTRLRVTVGGAPVDAAGQRRWSSASPESSIESSTTGLPSSSDAPHPVRDSGLPGPYLTRTSEYSLAGIPLTGLPYDDEVQGVVVRPIGATGPRPLVLFLHGRHSTCFRGGPDGRSSGAWPCRDNWQPIPSYRGYLDAQQLLASQGYVTVSISANGINGQDFRASDGGAQARSELVRHHLDLFEDWNTVGAEPFSTSLVGPLGRADGSGGDQPGSHRAGQGRSNRA